MPNPRKQKRHLLLAREAKKRKGEALEEPPASREGETPGELEEGKGLPAACVGWSELSDEDEGDTTEEDEPSQGKLDAFDIMARSSSGAATSGEVVGKQFRWQRGMELSERQGRRNRAAARDLANAAEGCRSIEHYFDGSLAAQNRSPPVRLQATEEELQARGRQDAIQDLQKKLKSKRDMPQGQNLTRHRAVLEFMHHVQKRTSRAGHKSREALALTVAEGMGKSTYFARNIVRWEKMWITERRIDEGRSGCFSKVRSWLNDEGVRLAVREWCCGAGEGITAYGLARAVGDHLASERATEILQESFEEAVQDAACGPLKSTDSAPAGTIYSSAHPPEKNCDTAPVNSIPRVQAPETEEPSVPPAALNRKLPGPIQVVTGRRLQIRARTARRWLIQMGYKWEKIRKGVFIDGHERKDVVAYRNGVFLPQWQSASRRFVEFKEDGSWSVPECLRPGEKPLVLITHDESTFSANDGRRQMWVKDSKQPLRKKDRGKGIMASGFLTPGGVLRVPEHIPDDELLQNPIWPKDKDGKAIRTAMHLLEYGKDNYWTGDKMVNQTIQDAIPIFRYAFPGCEAFFAFDNASNHCAFSENALVAAHMNLGPGGKQPKMKEGMDYRRNMPHSMVFPDNHGNEKLRGEPKGLKIVLQERGLWRSTRSDGKPFRLECKRLQNSETPNAGTMSGCQPELPGGCCARTLMSQQRDFQQQKGRLQEEVEAAGCSIIFYPKFHCELNFIERYWCAAKYFAREHCTYSLTGLRNTVPAALNSVSVPHINRFYRHCMRVLAAYMEGYTYGTKQFRERMYRGHRQVEDKSKW